MEEWKEQFSELFNACGNVPEECFIAFIQSQIDKAREETAREIIENLKCSKCGGDGVIVEVSYRWAIDPDGREYEEPYQELCQCNTCYATGFKILNSQDIEQIRAKYL